MIIIVNFLLFGKVLLIIRLLFNYNRFIHVIDDGLDLSYWNGFITLRHGSFFIILLSKIRIIEFAICIRFICFRSFLLLMFKFSISIICLLKCVFLPFIRVLYFCLYKSWYPKYYLSIAIVIQFWKKTWNFWVDFWFFSYFLPQVD